MAGKRELPVDEVYRLVFHGIDYMIALSVEKGTSILNIEVEHEGSTDRWHGEFSGKYIEQITQKTGNFKRFRVFVNMLSAALQKNNDAVFVDLLTYADLELLKTRKGGENSSGVSNTSASFRGNNKRYLILTYTVEFDRVHYPLPLAFEDTPNVSSLRRTIVRLQKELKKKEASEKEAPSGAQMPTSAMKAELEALRKANRKLKSSRGSVAATTSAYERLKDESAIEISRLNKDVRSLTNRLQSSEKDREKLRSRVTNNEGSYASATQDSTRQVKAVLRKISAVEKALDNERNSHLRTKRKAANYAAKAKKEVANLKGQIQKLRLNVRDAKIAARRAASASPAGRSLSRSSRLSTASTNRSTASVRTSSSSIRSRSSIGSRSRSPAVTRGKKKTGSGRRKKLVSTSSTSITSSTSSRRVRSNVNSSRASNTSSRRGRSNVNSSRTSNTSSRRGRSSVNSSRLSNGSRANRSGSRRHYSPYDSGYSSAASASSAEGAQKKRTRIAKRRSSSKSKTKKGTARKKVLRSASAERRREQLLQRDRMRIPSKTASKKETTRRAGVKSTSSSGSIGRPKSAPKEASRPPRNSKRTSAKKAAPPAPSTKLQVALPPPDSPGLNDGSFDANTEMADIDRRLNALQDFLKEAKAGAGNTQIEETIV